MNTIAVAAAIAGAAAGRLTRRIAPSRDEPSIRAARSISTGTPRKAPRTSQMRIGDQNARVDQDEAEDRVADAEVDDEESTGIASAIGGMSM